MTGAPLAAGDRRVAVKGGELAVEVIAGDTAPVLAVHGISSQRRLWDWLHAADPGVTLIAPDLRGRGDSVDVEGPSSIPQHGEDMIAVLDAFGIDAVDVCGMSMGGFIAVDMADRYPDRVRSLILVDGGFPMASPPGLTRELLPQVFADRLGRLAHEWASVDDYLAYFTSQTAPLLDPADPLLRTYLAHDLRDGRVRLSSEALLGDAESVFFDGNPWEQLSLPIRFLHASWSAGEGTAPAYPPDAVERYRVKTVSTTLVDGVDHAGSIMTARGGAATAAAIREALG